MDKCEENTSADPWAKFGRGQERVRARSEEDECARSDDTNPKRSRRCSGEANHLRNNESTAETGKNAAHMEFEYGEANERTHRRPHFFGELPKSSQLLEPVVAFRSTQRISHELPQRLQIYSRKIVHDKIEWKKTTKFVSTGASEAGTGNHEKVKMPHGGRRSRIDTTSSRTEQATRISPRSRGPGDTYVETNTLDKPTTATSSPTTGVVVVQKNSRKVGRGFLASIRQSEAYQRDIVLCELRNNKGPRQAPNRPTCDCSRLLDSSKLVFRRPTNAKQNQTDLGRMDNQTSRENPCDVDSDSRRFGGNTRELHSQNIHGTFNETGCSERTNCSGDTEENSSNVNERHVEAQNQTRGVDSSGRREIHLRQAARGFRDRNEFGNNPFVGPLQCSVTSTSKSMVKWPKRGTAKPEGIQCTWDLHTPKVGLAKTQSIVRAAGDFRLTLIWDTINSLPPPTGEFHETTRSNLEERDLPALEAAEFVVERPESMITAIAKSTPEPNKLRRRFLIWCKKLNEKFPYIPEVHLKTPEEVIQEILQSPQSSSIHEQYVARHFDLTSAYNQHAIDATLQAYLVFHFNNRNLAMTRLPMGARFSPEVQQRLTEWLANTAIASSTIPLTSVIATVHIDNIRFYGLEWEVQQAAVNFVAICAHFSVTLNPQDEDEDCDFLGMHFHYAKREVTLADKTVKKLQKIDWSERTILVEDFLSIFGKLFFCSAVLSLPLFAFYYAIKQYRKVGYMLAKQQLTLESKIDWWTDSLHQVRLWCNMAIVNAPRKTVPEHPEKWVIFADASDKGFGLVLLGYGIALSCGESWDDSSFRKWNDKGWIPDINQREVIATEAATTWINMLGLQRAQVDLLVDNMTSRSANRLERSRNWHINAALARAHDVDPTSWRSVEWISTKRNISDHPSRYPELYLPVNYKQHI